MYKLKYLLLYWLLLYHGLSVSFGQSGPKRFLGEVQEISSKMPKNRKDVVLFTGSSSIRIWNDLTSYFPKYNVVNRGFGGSSMTDLLFYCDELILKLRPTMIFIYEGDNDLADGKSPEAILSTSDSLIQKIRRNISTTVPIYFISPKPSIARWKLKEKYIEYNQKLKDWTTNKRNVGYIDGWTSLLDVNGNVLQDVFVSDNLHLNKKGYALWSKAIRQRLP